MVEEWGMPWARRAPNSIRSCAAAALALTLLWSVAASARPLKLQVGERDVDVENRTIQFRLNAKAADAELKIYSAEGSLLHQATTELGGAKAGTRMSVTWPDLGKEGENFRLELTVTDDQEHWVAFEVVRFYLEIPHEDVIFASGSWEIAAEQVQKLEDPLDTLKEAAKRYGKIMQVRLYVAGYTDTVGAPADNQRLSERRAHSIARYFAEHGLKGVQIFVRGFGEGALLVKTADNADEPRNRRAQYIVSTFTPHIAGPGSWKRAH